MKKLKLVIAGFLMVLGVSAAVPVLSSGTAFADDPSAKIKEGVTGIGGDNAGPKLEDQIKTIVNVMLFILGAIAVIMIIIGGIRYTISNGDSAAIKSGKDTILYAVIGLIVAILAYAIVNFVITSFGSK